MRLQIISDLHSEFNKKWKPPILAPNIALLGDLGLLDKNYLKILTYFSQNYQRVFLVLGNHEFYKSYPEQVFSRLMSILRLFDNIYFLNNSSIIIEGIKIIGTTLWSYIPYSHGFEIMSKINDYRYIYLDSSGQKISFWETNRWHLQAVEYLKQELKEEIPTIILTHHSPLSDSKEKLSYAFGTDLKHLFKPWIKLWAYGHTHLANFSLIGETRLISNPLGYPGEQTGYDPNLVVEI